MVFKIIIVVLRFGTIGAVILGVATPVLPRPSILGRVWQDEEFFGKQWAMIVHRGLSWAINQSKSDKELSRYRFGTNRSFVERSVHPVSRSHFIPMLG